MGSRQNQGPILGVFAWRSVLLGHEKGFDKDFGQHVRRPLNLSKPLAVAISRVDGICESEHAWWPSLHIMTSPRVNVISLGILVVFILV